MRRANRLPLDKDGNINPMIGVCPCCKKDTNEIFFLGANKKKLQTADGRPADEHTTKMFSDTICDDCAEVLDNGGIWIRKADKHGKVGPASDGIRLRARIAQDFIDAEVYAAAREHNGLLNAMPEDFEQITAVLQQLLQGGE